MQFRTSYTWHTPRGVSRTFVPSPVLGGDLSGLTIGGAAVGLGSLIRTAARNDAAAPQDVAAAFLVVLRSGRSEWPSNGGTANLGPYATGRSLGHFLARQGRTATGQFGPWLILNDARNDAGNFYAADVDRGIRSDGRQMSATRYAANFRAVDRTYRNNIDEILRTSIEIQRQRSGR